MLYHLGTYFIDHTSEVGRVAVRWGGSPSPIPVQSCRAQSQGEFTSLPSLKPNFLPPPFFLNQNSKIHLSKVMFISDLRCLWNGCFLAALLFREASHCIFSTVYTFSGAEAEGLTVYLGEIQVGFSESGGLRCPTIYPENKATVLSIALAGGSVAHIRHSL